MVGQHECQNPITSGDPTIGGQGQNVTEKKQADREGNLDAQPGLEKKTRSAG